METQTSTESTMTQIELGEEGKLQKEKLLKDGQCDRRAYIDILNIFIVFGFFFGRILEIYGTTDHAVIKHPANDHSGIFEDFLITEDKYTIIPLDHWNFILQVFGRSYLLSLFYFLSGFTVFLSLNKRTEQQFREERVHGVLVPTFTILILHLSSAFVAFAPLDHSCTLEYEANARLYASYSPYNETNRCQLHLKIFQNHTPFLSTLVQSTWDTLAYNNMHLLCIFLWAQMFAFWFCAVHPNINRQGEPSITYCGTSSCCCSRKPFSRPTKFFCCFNFFCKPAASPSELINSLNWYLNGPVRLMLVPGLIIYLIDILTGVWFISYEVTLLESLFPNMAIFAFGFHIAATESSDIGRLVMKQRKTYLTIGLFLFLADAVLLLTANDLDHQNGVTSHFWTPLNYFFRSFGKWPFILGILGVTRTKFEKQREWITLARSLSLPFFITCQSVIVIYLTGALWVPYLRGFPFTLVFCSFICLLFSYFVTKTGYFGYFFGVQSSKTSIMRKKKIFRLIPIFFLLSLVILINILLYKFKDVYDPQFEDY